MLWRSGQPAELLTRLAKAGRANAVLPKACLAVQSFPVRLQIESALRPFMQVHDGHVRTDQLAVDSRLSSSLGCPKLGGPKICCPKLASLRSPSRYACRYRQLSDNCCNVAKHQLWLPI